MKISFYNSNNELVQTETGGIQSNPTTFIFQDIELLNVPSNPHLAYVIEINNTTCHKGEFSGSITVLPAPKVQISIAENGSVFCAQNSINTVLNASVEGGGSATYQWFHGNNEIPGETSSQLDLSNVPNADFGYYSVKVTKNNCTSKSNNINIRQDCGSGNPPECSQPQNVNLNVEWGSCEEINLTASYTTNNGYLPNSFTWYRESDFTLENASLVSANNPYRTYKPEAAGKYHFSVKLNYGDGCVFSALDSVVVGYVIDMKKEIVCDGQQYTVTLKNTSDYYDQNFIDNTAVSYEIYNLDLGITEPLDSFNNDEAVATLGEGEYELKLNLSRPGYPTCTYVETIDLRLPDASFSISPTEYCSNESVTLVPDHPLPGATYKWEWQEKTNFSETLEPDLEPMENTKIKLTIIDPFGCSDQYTLDPGIDIFEAEFNGTIKPDSPTICEGGSINLNYIPSGNETPFGFQWYHNSMQISGATTSSLLAEDPGEYTIKLYDAHGCEYNRIDGVFVNVLPPPHLTIKSHIEICEGNSYTFSGKLSPEDAEFRIYEMGTAPPSSWHTGPQVNYTVNNLAPGSYTYVVEYRDSNHPSCVESKTLHIDVYPAVNLSVDFNVISCDPYVVELTADSSGAPGWFTWSDGQSGPTIEVDHGGRYLVRFHPDEGPCRVSETIFIPKPPSQFSWIFPDGCFDFCPSKNMPYVIGPLYDFDNFHWNIDGIAQSSGTGLVSDYYITEMGDLTLSLDNGDCEIVTDPLHINQGRSCNRKCNIDFVVDNIILVQETPYPMYHILGSLHNNYPEIITVEMGTLDGVFIQSPLAMNPNQVLNFTSANPLIFIPNSGFNGGMSSLDLRGRANINGNKLIICNETHYLNFPTQSNLPMARIDMNVSPNPTTGITEIRYEIFDLPEFDQGKMVLYSLSGLRIETRTIRQSEGILEFDLSGLASGNYVLVFHHKNTRLGQQIIIKK